MGTKLFGLLQNRLMENAKMPTPVVGMGATILMYSDRYACTIIEVTPKRIVLQHDAAKDKAAYANDWETTPDPKGATEAYTLRKTGEWVKEGSPLRNGTRALIGTRDHHRDYEF